MVRSWIVEDKTVFPSLSLVSVTSVDGVNGSVSVGGIEVVRLSVVGVDSALDSIVDGGGVVDVSVCFDSACRFEFSPVLADGPHALTRIGPAIGLHQPSSKFRQLAWF